MVAHPDSGENSFSLRVEEGKIVYEYQLNVNETRQFTLSTDLELSSTVYQIQLSTASNVAEVLLQRVNATSTVTVERLSTGTGNPIYPVDTIFSTVCVGGSLLEYANYRGTIRSAFYGYNSLLEERNFCRLGTEGVARSEVIMFADNDIPRSLTFERFTLGSERIVFQARSRFENPMGTLLRVESPPFQFSMNVLNTNVFMLLRRTTVGGKNEFMLHPFVFDGEWHSYVISLDVASQEPSLSIIVDGVTSTFPPTNLTREALPVLVNSSLRFGDKSFSDSNIFRGCVSGMELQLNSTSEVFRPNLEAVPRVNGDTFDVDSCYHCSKSKSRTRACQNGQVCTDRGVGLETNCECREGFSGAMCEGMTCVYVCEVANELNILIWGVARGGVFM